MLARHPAYEAAIGRVMAAFLDPARAADQSSAEQIAEVVWEAATDGKDQVTYLAGADAKKLFAQRLSAGAETFRRAIKQQFLG